MPISEALHKLLMSAQTRTEALLADPAANMHLLGEFHLPPDIDRDVRRRLAAADIGGHRVTAFLRALDWFAATSPGQALGMAFALQAALASKGIKGLGDASGAGQRFLGIPQIMHAVSFALIGAGAFEEVLAVSEQLVPELRLHGFPLNAQAFLVAAAEAEFRLGQPAKARALLPDRVTIERAAVEQDAVGAPLSANPILVRRDNLQHELLHVETAAIAETRPFLERSATILAETKEAVRVLLSRNKASAEEIEEALTKIEALAEATAQSSGMIQAVELLAVLEEILGPLVPGLPLRSPGLRVATEALRSNDSTIRDAALEELSRLQDEEWNAGDIDGWLAYSWQKSLILERHGQLVETLALLEAIGMERDKLAGGAPSFRERAGISSTFRDLPQRTAALQLRLGAGAEAAFATIEAGKGRWLGDSAVAKAPGFVELRGILADRRIHYLTYAVGADATVAVFIPAIGAPMAADIPFGRERIAGVARDLVRERDFCTDLCGNLRRRLGPLTEWLPAPVSDGVMRPGDVLIYAPHGALHSIPLHAMPASDGHSLAPRLAVVRTHGAGLVERTARTNVDAVGVGLALHAAVKNEKQRNQREASFGEIVRELEGVFSCATLEGIEADFENLKDAMRPRQLIHVFAHGDAVADAPYSKSGVLLSDRGNLPERGWRAFHTDHLVSPERIASGCLDEKLSGSHVTLQACVSGHAQANLRGDAIGLEWSLLLSGVSSVLATHWHVGFVPSTDFCRIFYRNWLGSGHGRAEAWRHAAQTLHDAGQHAAWAAFSLTGDWR